MRKRRLRDLEPLGLFALGQRLVHHGRRGVVAERDGPDLNIWGGQPLSRRHERLATTPHARTVRRPPSKRRVIGRRAGGKPS